MNMHVIDWIIVAALLTVLTGAAIYTKRFTLSVADFLAANRCARRYLLSVSDGMAGVGAISIMAGFEMYYQAGFTAAWWQLLPVVVTTVISLSGWVFYRFRQSRALTLAQFLEMRYSKNFRIFTGLIAYLSGIVNFGIFPAVGARFFIHFCGMPDTTIIYAAVMAVLLAIALFFTFLGGHIAVMVTDFLQGVFTNCMFVVILIVLLCMFSWEQIGEGLAIAPANASLIQPFHTTDTKSFNIWYFIILAATQFYTTGAWQGNSGFNAAALNAHEARMGKILSTWRILPLNLFMMIVPICAYVFMHHASFTQNCAAANSLISQIDNPAIQKQMTTTIALKFILPMGLMGALVGIMLSAFIGNCDTYLHSWGTIFIQDVIMPFRNKPLNPQQHIRTLKWSIFGVAVFIFCFSLIFRQTEYIYMFFMITGAIFVGGAGAVVLGGLYWKKGTTAAAWSAMIAGSSLAVAAVILQQIHHSYPFTSRPLAYIASQNGAVLSFYASAAACLIYVVVSLTDRGASCDLDKILHRGQYASETVSTHRISLSRRIASVLGFSNEFTFFDTVLYASTLVWTFGWVLIFFIVSLYNLFWPASDTAWLVFWKYYTILTLVLSATTAVWFGICGGLDLKYLFMLLKKIERNHNDNGSVSVHRQAEIVPTKAVRESQAANN